MGGIFLLTLAERATQGQEIFFCILLLDFFKKLKKKKFTSFLGSNEPILNKFHSQVDSELDYL